MKTVKELLQTAGCRPMTLVFEGDQKVSGLLSEVRVDREKDIE